MDRFAAVPKVLLRSVCEALGAPIVSIATSPASGRSTNVRWLQSNKAVVATCDATEQRIVLGPPVVTHVQHFRQSLPFASEAGGQLFGTVSPDVVNVEAASGPYPGDERSRYRYRSDPRAAQAAIEHQAGRARRGRLRGRPAHRSQSEPPLRAVPEAHQAHLLADHLSDGRAALGGAARSAARRAAAGEEGSGDRLRPDRRAGHHRGPARRRHAHRGDQCQGASWARP